MEKRFISGDVVKLKSGGPQMTVKYYNSIGEITVSWFVESELKEASLSDGQLEKVVE